MVICPYQGLAAFTEADAEFFFGRESLMADLVDHLRGNPRFLAVVGPSGSGKSSAVQAGLFPALRRGKVPGSEDWLEVVDLDGANSNLRRGVVALVRKGDQEYPMSLADLKFVNPDPTSAEWLEVYRYWLGLTR